MTEQGPAYRRVLDDLRSMILSGQLSPGDRLPSVREIAERHDVPTGTVVRAISELKSEGRVISRHGSGVYVREFRTIRRSSPSRLAASRGAAGESIQDADTGDRPRTVGVEIGEVTAPKWVGEALGLDLGAPVAFRRRRFVVDERSVQLSTSYVPVDLARGTAIMHTDTGPGGVYARLAEAGHEPAVFREELTCRMPNPDEVAELSLPDGTPVIEVTRYAYDAGGRCVEINRMLLDATAYVLDYTFAAYVPAPGR